MKKGESPRFEKDIITWEKEKQRAANLEDFWTDFFCWMTSCCPQATSKSTFIGAYKIAELIKNGVLQVEDFSPYQHINIEKLIDFTNRIHHTNKVSPHCGKEKKKFEEHAIGVCSQDLNLRIPVVLKNELKKYSNAESIDISVRDLIHWALIHNRPESRSPHFLGKLLDFIFFAGDRFKKKKLEEVVKSFQEELFKDPGLIEQFLVNSREKYEKLITFGQLRLLLIRAKKMKTSDRIDFEKLPVISQVNDIKELLNNVLERPEEYEKEKVAA